MNAEVKFDLSFIIVSWNAKEYLRECINSLYDNLQDLQYEIIVVDNASTDGSWEMVRDEFPGVYLIINSDNLGFAEANNKGIEISKGKYLCLINSDVKVIRHSVESLYHYIENYPKVGIVGPRVLNGDLSLQPSCRTFPTLRSSFFRALKLDTRFKKSAYFAQHFMTDWNYDDTRDVDILSGCFWMIRRTALYNVGLLDTQFFIYGEDMDLCKRFHEAGWKLVFCHNAEIIHYGGASSSKNPSRFWIEMQRANLQYWLKHNNITSAYVYYACLLLHNFLRLIGLSTQKIIGLSLSEKAKTRLNSSKSSLKWLLSGYTIENLISKKNI